MGKGLKNKEIIEFLDKIGERASEIMKQFLHTSEGAIIFSIIMLEALSQLGITQLEYLKFALLGLLGAKAVGEIIPF